MDIPMRREDRRLGMDETYALLAEAEYGILSTVCPDGTPYGLPMSFAFEDGNFYMHCTNEGGQKIINIRHGGEACFTVVGHTRVTPESFGTRYMSAMAYGRVGIVGDASEKRRGLLALLRKYSPEYMEQGLKYMAAAEGKVDVLKFVIEHVTGKGRR